MLTRQSPRIGLCSHWLIASMACIAMLSVAPTISAADASATASATSSPIENFTLTTHDNLVSLQAHNASLKAVVEKLGKELRIAVENKLPQDELVNTEFEQLSVAEALKRLSRNYAYEADEKSGVVTRIVLMPRGDATVRGKLQPSIAPEHVTQMPIAPAAAIQISSEDNIRHDTARSAAMGSGETQESTGEDKQRAEAAPFEFSFDPSAMDDAREK